MYTDSHAHLTSEQVIDQIDPILARALEASVTKVVNICTDAQTLRQGLKLKKRYPWIYNTAATTPHDVEAEGESFFPLVEQAVADRELVALGETGLDYFYEHSNRALQKRFLLKYFDLALSAQLPLIFHCRDAFSDLFAFADVDYKDAPGLLHCFTGTVEEARGVLDRGWYLSLSGIVTFKKSEALREVAKFVPLDRLLIETDTPYLAPQSHRGMLNEPSFIIETAACLAAVLGKSVQEVAEATSLNAEKFFSFSKLI
ncbi:MAG: TatD family hydrolase [Rhabdochlamydiaceae bacterium]|nr:TatD family hydrolase [Rhabdochlamydiaceae bacterium]